MHDRETLIALTQESVRNVIGALRAMPRDKYRWTPFEGGRCATDQVVECYQAAEFFAKMIATKGDMDPRELATRRAEAKAEREADHDLAEMEARMNAAFSDWYEVIRNFDESVADQPFRTPGGLDTTFGELLMFPMRNNFYHFGQINYIQTALGDYQMHT